MRYRKTGGKKKEGDLKLLLAANGARILATCSGNSPKQDNNARKQKFESWGKFV